MNTLEKKSYFSFVALYVVSTFILITLGAFWYYSGQKHAQDNMLHYKLQHISADVSSKVIYAHMMDLAFELPDYGSDYTIALLDAHKGVVYGNLPPADFPLERGLFEADSYDILVTTGTNDHLGIRYVVVATTQVATSHEALQLTVLKYYIAALLFTAVIGMILSHFFLEPIRQKVAMIERFIKDVTHELNTPNTALSMSTERAMQKKAFDERIMRNISVSTKQLYDIYSALAYINFDHQEKTPGQIDLAQTVQKSVVYFDELAASKQIRLTVETERTPFRIDTHQASMLINNLISNAIKYSPVGSTVTLLLKNGTFLIKDEGVGIEKEKLSCIFERFERATDYAGGFGLGLSIVKTICDEYGIAIKVTSEPDHGTTVMLFLDHTNL